MVTFVVRAGSPRRLHRRHVVIAAVTALHFAVVASVVCLSSSQSLSLWVHDTNTGIGPRVMVAVAVARVRAHIERQLDAVHTSS